MPVTPLCVACDRPTADGYACTGCTGKARGHLAQIADMTPAARDIAHRQTSGNGGGGAGKPGSTLPLDLGATARLDAVQGVLTTWERHILAERGRWVDHAHPGIDHVVASSTRLQDHLEWMRHRPEVDEFLADVAAAARVIASIARGPSEQKYLGPCGALIVQADDLEVTCDGDIYGRPGADKGTCRTCGATVDQAERRAWLDDEVRQHAYRASEIEDAYGIKANLIRQWATPERGMLRVHDRDFLGRARYMLGEVLDLAAAQAAKRAERQAERERRAAARQAAEMGA